MDANRIENQCKPRELMENLSKEADNDFFDEVKAFARRLTEYSKEALEKLGYSCTAINRVI